MRGYENLEMCIAELRELSQSIEKELADQRPSGETYRTYYEVREQQLNKMEMICRQLMELQSEIII